MSAHAEPGLTLIAVRRMMEGVVPPSLCTVSADGMPSVNYLSLAEYVDPEHVALSFQFFNKSRENVLATRRASLTLDDPYTGAGVALQLAYLRTETEGPTFERIRAKLAGIASHAGMEKVFVLRGADIYRVIALRRVPGRRELPAALPRCDLAATSRMLSERLARCEQLPELVDALLTGLEELLLIPHAMLWLMDPARDGLVLLASRGYAAQGTGAELALGEGLAGMAARERVPIRVGHIMSMQTYGRAARERVSELGLSAVLDKEIPLPGLTAPRSQLAVPLMACRRLVGVLFVESQHDQYFGYDDEDALMMLGAQLAAALVSMQALDPDQDAGEAEGPDAASGPPLKLKRTGRDNSIYLDGEYLIRGVAGAILWKIARDHAVTGRRDFTNRELRASPEIGLPDVADNLEVRLLLLQRRLAENRAPLRIEKTGRGRFRLSAGQPLQLEDAAERAAGD